jgi:acyl-coenzyme A thioesterase PaaI-like protein
LAEDTLEAHETEVLARADRALNSTVGKRGFLRHFWGFLPETISDGARCQIDNGPHLGNRVGHMQGGLQLGMAIITAEAALPAGWRVAGISAFFLSAGEGSGITAHSRIEHHGRNTAVVRTTLTTQSGRRVLDAVTTHLRRD